MSFRKADVLRKSRDKHRLSEHDCPGVGDSCEEVSDGLDCISSRALDGCGMSLRRGDSRVRVDHYKQHNGKLSNNVYCQGESGTGEVRIRSVAEMLAAESIMKRAGKWDDGEGKYYTKEQQLQNKMTYFQSLHQSLKFSPSGEYTRRQTEVAEGKLAVPRRDKVAGERKRKVNFGTAGTDLRTASTVVDGATLTRRQLNELRRTHPLLRNSPVLEVTKTMQINSQPLNIFDDGLDAPPASHVGSLHAAPSGVHDAELGHSMDADKPAVPRPAEAQKAPPPLPKISPMGCDPAYSSLLMQLKRTKQQVVDHGQSLDTVTTLLELDGSAQLKKTITRIFANPKDAAAITEAEYQKRQDQYAADRARIQEQQQEELKDQRIELEREIGHLLTSTDSKEPESL